MWTLLLHWFLFGGILFVLIVGVWVIVVISRMQREQAVAMAEWRACEARAGLTTVINKIEQAKKS